MAVVYSLRLQTLQLLDSHVTLVQCSLQMGISGTNKIRFYAR